MARLRAYAQLQPDMFAVEIASREDRYGFWSASSAHLAFRRTTLFHDAIESVPVSDQLAAAEHWLSDHDPAAVVVAGYAEAVMRAAAAWAQRRDRPVVMMCDSTRADRRRWAWKEWAKRLLVRRLYDCAFVAGGRAAQYMRELGINGELIWKGCDVVDNEHFRSAADAARARPEKARRELELPDRYFLYVGRFAPEKNLARLLEAYDTYRRRGGQWELVLLGSGPLQEELPALAERQQIPGVHWPGPKSYEELPLYYGLASCFILPSIREPWGLVVNEAEASGLPVLVSEKCGCVPELVHRGVNGYCFRPDDVDGLARLMLKVSGGDVDLHAFGEASRRIVSLYTPETWARALADCVETMLDRRRVAEKACP